MSNRTFMHYGWIIIALVVLTAILFTATPFTQLVFNTAQKPVEDIGNQLDTCSHLHTKQESSYTRQDNDRHEVITRTVCEDCGKTLSEYSLGVYENHVYDENYVCTLCGYIHQHAHTTLITSKYKDFDETRHIYVSSYACNCGHVIDYVNFIGEHEYPADGNICSLCGHVKAKPSQSINIDNVSFIMRYGTGTRSSFISSSDGGTLHVTSSNPSCVQATITDGVITFEVLKPSDTPVTVTITADATENYGPGTLDVTVFAQKGTQKIVPSSGGMSIRITNTKPFSAVAEGTGVASPSVITLNTLVGGTESNSVARYTGTNGQLSISGDLYGASEGLAYVHLSLSENDYYEAAEMYIPITVSSLLEQEISVSSKSNFSDSVTSVTKTYNDPNFTLYAKTNGNGALSVSSSNTNVIAASISGGTITLDVKNAGSSTITVSAAQTLTYASSTYTVTITVQKQTPAVTFNDINITYGEAAKTATYTVTTGTSSELSVVYKTTNNTNVAVSSNFTVTALKAGTSVITYTISGNAENVGNYNTIESTCTVTIAKATQTVNASNISIVVDGQKNIGATVTGNGTATKGTLTYVSADTNKLTVDESGKLTAHKGVAESDSTTVKVTIYAAENDWYNPASKEITVTITKKTPTITLSKDALNLLYNGVTGVVNYSTNGPTLPVANVTTSDKTVAYLVASAHSTTAFTVSPNHIQVSDSVNTYQTTEGGGTAYDGRIGTATITITFPTDEYWLGATRTIPVTVTKGTPVLTINSGDASALSDVPFGTDRNLRYSWIGDNNLSVTSSNTSIFTVSPAANWKRNQTVTIHPVAPGTATVDFTAAEGTHFTALSKQSVTVTVTKGTQTLVPSITSWSTSYNNTKTFDLSSSTKSGTAAFGAVTYKMGSQSYVTSGTSSDSVASISYNSSTGVFTLTTIKPGTTKAYLYYAATSHYNASDVVEIEITVAKGTQTTNTSINSWNTAYSGSTTLNIESSTKSGSQPFGTIKYKIGSQSYVTSGTSADTIASVSYNSSTGVFTLTSLKPGTTVFYVYHESTDYYNASTVKTLTITITKGTQTMVSDTTSWNVPYGSTKSVSIAGSTKSGSHAYGTITYKMGSNSYISNGSSSDAVASISYNTSTGKFELSTVKPGTTKAYIKYASSDWYNESNVVEISITVTKGSQSISSVSNLGNVKYGTNPATAITLTKSGSADFGTISVTSSLPEAATVALSGSGNSRTSTVTTVKPNDNTVTITISIAGNDYYEAATNVTYTLKVIKGDQTLSMSDAAIAFTSTGSAWSPTTATRTVTLTKSGTASYGALTAVSSSNAVATASLSGSGDSRTLTVTPVAAGTCDVTVSLAGNDYYNASTPASIKITNVSVTKKTQTLTSDKTSVSITYNGTATVTIGGNSTGLRYIMSDSSTAPADSSFVSSGATSTTTAQASAPVSGKFTITSLKPGTTYLYVYAPENTYNDRSTNTVKVTITVSKGSQSIDMNTDAITFTSTGTAWAPSATQSKTATLSKSGSSAYGTFSASSSDTSVATVGVSGSGDSRTVTVAPGTKEGTATITVSLAGTDWYNAATNKTFTVTVTKLAQTITSNKPSGVSLFHRNSDTITIGSANTTIIASSSNEKVATVSVSGNVVTVTAASYSAPADKPTASCTISIYAQENTYYRKSNTLSITVSVTKGTQTLTMSTAEMTFTSTGSAWSPATNSKSVTLYKSGDAPYGALTATSSSTSIATVAVSGSGDSRTVTVTPVANGTATITVTIAGTDYYSGDSKSFTVYVNKKNQTWTIGNVTLTYNPSSNPTANIVITGDVYGDIQYKIGDGSYVSSGDSSNSVAKVSKSGSNYVVTGLTAGTTTVYLKSAGNTYYSAREVSCTVTVNKAASSISTTSASATYGNGASNTTVSKTGDGSLVLDTTPLNTSIATVSLSGSTLTVTPVKPGTTSVYLRLTEGTNYAACSNVAVTITVNKNTQTITSLTPSSITTYVSGTTTLTATASHGGSGSAACGAISFVSSNTSVATVTNSGSPATVTGVSKGSTTITVSVAATDYYTTTSSTVTVSVRAVTNFTLTPSAISVTYDRSPDACSHSTKVWTTRSDYPSEAYVCSSCGKVFDVRISGTNPSVRYGDVNADGVVNDVDGETLLHYLAHWDGVTVNAANADVNGDGSVNGKDSTKLLQYLTQLSTSTVALTGLTEGYDGTITVSSSNSNVATATISGSGTSRIISITTGYVGTATITVSAPATSGYTAQSHTISVTVNPLQRTLTADKTNVSLTNVNDTTTVTINTNNFGTLTATSASTSIATCSLSGSNGDATRTLTIRLVSVGTTSITVTAQAYNAGGSSENEYTAKTIVILVKKGSALSVTPSSKSIRVGDTSSATVSALNGYPLSCVTISGYNSSIIDNVSYNTSTGVISFRGKSVGTTTITISGPAVGDFTAPIATTLTIEVANSQSSQTVSLFPTSLSLTRGYVYTGQTNSTWSHTGYGSYNSASTTLGGTYVGTITWRVGTSNAWITGNGSQTDGNITVTRSGNTFTATTSGDGSTTLYVYATATTSGMVDYLVSNTATCTITASHSTTKDVYNKGIVSQSPTLTPSSISLTRGWIYSTLLGSASWSLNGYNTSYGSESTILGGTYYGTVSWRVGTSNSWLTGNGSQKGTYVNATRTSSTFAITADSPNTADSDGTSETLYVKIGTYETDYVVYQETTITCTVSLSHDSSEDQKLKSSQVIWWNEGKTDNADKNITLTTSSSTITYYVYTKNSTYSVLELEANSSNTGVATVSVDNINGKITITRVANGSADITVYAEATIFLSQSNTLTVHVTCANSGASQSPTLTPSSLSLTRGYVYTGQNNNTWSHTGYGSYNSATTTLGGTYGGTVYWKLGTNAETTGNGSQTSGYITVTRSSSTFTATATSNGSSDGTSATLYVRIGAYTSAGVDYSEANVTCTISLSHSTSKDAYNKGGQSVSLSPASLGLTRGFVYTGQLDHTWAHTGYGAYNSASTTLGGTYSGTIYWKLGSNDYITGNGNQTSGKITVTRSGSTFTATATSDGSSDGTSATLYVYAAATDYVNASSIATCTISLSRSTSKDTYNKGSQSLYWNSNNTGTGDQNATLTTASPSVSYTIYTIWTSGTVSGKTYRGALLTASSSNTGVATVSVNTSTGVVTITKVANGTCTISVQATSSDYLNASNTLKVNITCSNSGGSQSPSLTPSSLGLTRGYSYTGQSNNTWSHTGYTSYNSSTITLGGTYGGTVSWKLGDNSYVTTNTSQTSGKITVSRSGTTFTVTATSDGSSDGTSATLYVNVAAYSAGGVDYSAATVTCTISLSHVTSKDTYNAGSGSQSITLSPTALSLTRGYIYTGTVAHSWSHTGYGSYNTGTTTISGTYGGTVTASSSNTGVATVSLSGTTVTATAVADGSVTITVSVASYSTSATKVDGSGSATCYNWGATSATCSVTVGHSTGKDVYNKGSQSIYFNSGRTDTSNKACTLTTASPSTTYTIYTAGTSYRAALLTAVSSNTSIATVSVNTSTGVVTITKVANGSCTVTVQATSSDYLNASNTLTINVTCTNSSGGQSVSLSSTSLGLEKISEYVGQVNHTWGLVGGSYNSLSSVLSGTYGGTIYWRVGTSNSWSTSTSGSQTDGYITVSRSSSTFTASATGDGSTTLYVYAAAYSAGGVDYSASPTVTCTISASTTNTYTKGSQNLYWNSNNTGTGDLNVTLTTAAPSISYNIYTPWISGGISGKTYRCLLLTASSNNTGIATVSVNTSTGVVTITKVANGSCIISIKASSSDYLNESNTLKVNVTCSNSGASQSPTLTPSSLSLTRGYNYVGKMSNDGWQLSSYGAYNSASTTLSGTIVGTVSWRVGTSNSWSTATSGSQSDGNITVTRSGSTFTATASGDGSTTLYINVAASSAGGIDYSAASTTCTISASHSTSKDTYPKTNQSIYWDSGKTDTSAKNVTLQTVSPSASYTIYVGGETYNTGLLGASSSNTGVATVNVSSGVVTVTRVANGSCTVTIQATSSTYLNASNTLTLNVTCTSSSQNPTLSPNSLSLTRGYVYTGTPSNTWSHTGYGAYNSASTTLGGSYVETISWRVGTSNSWSTSTSGSQTDGNITVTRSGSTFTATASGDGSTTLYVKAVGSSNYNEATATCTISASHSTSKDTHNKGGGNQSITLTPSSGSLTRTLTYRGQSNNTWLLESDSGFGTTTTTISGTYGGTISVSSSNTGVATVSRSGTTVTITGVANGSATITVSVAAYSTDYYNWGATSATYSITVSTVYIHNPGSGDQTITLTPNALTVRPGNTATTTIGGTHGGTITVTSSATGKATASRSGNTVTVTGVATGSATITASVAAYSTSAAKMDGSGNATCYNWGAAEATCSVTVSNSLVSQTITSDKTSVSLTRTVYRTGTVNNTWAVTSYGSYNSNTVTISGAQGTLNWILSSATSAPASGYVTTTTAQTVNGITVSRSGSVFTITAASNGTAYLYVYADAKTVGTTDYPKSNTLKITITSANGANSDSKGSQTIAWASGSTATINSSETYNGSLTASSVAPIITMGETYRGDLLTATSSNSGVMSVSVNTSTGKVTFLATGVGTATITIQATGNTYLNASNTLTMNVTVSYNEGSQSFSFNSSYSLDIYRTGTLSHTWTVNGSESTDVSNPYIRGTIHWILSSSASAPASGYVTTDTSTTVNNITVSKDGNTFTLTAGSTSGTAYLYVYADETVADTGVGVFHYAATSTQKVTITSSYSDTKGSQSIYFNSGRTDQAAKSNSFNVGNGTTYTIYTAGTSYRAALLTATSSNSSVASVSVNTSTGKVTINGVATGSATITIKANSSTYLNASNTLTVNITVNAALIERPYSWTSNSFTGTIYEATKGVKATYTFHTLGTGAVTWSGTFTSNPTGTRVKDTSLVDGEATYTFTGSASNNNGSTFTLTCTVAADSTYKSVSGSITITYRTTPKPGVDVPSINNGVVLYQGCGFKIDFGSATAPGSGVNITVSGAGSEWTGNIPPVVVKYITYTNGTDTSGWYLIGLKEGTFTFSISIPAYSAGGTSYSASVRTLSNVTVERTVVTLEGAYMGTNDYVPCDMAGDYDMDNNRDTLSIFKQLIPCDTSHGTKDLAWVDGGDYDPYAPVYNYGSLVITDFVCPVCNSNYVGTRLLITGFIETFLPGTRIMACSPTDNDFSNAQGNWYDGQNPVRQIVVPAITFCCDEPGHGQYSIFLNVTSITIDVPSSH